MSIKWYVAIVLIAITISLVPKLIGIMLGLGRGKFFVIGSLPVIMAVFLRQVLTSGLGEEPGWRGYLQPYLQSRYNIKKSIWILGAIWTVWHFPFTIYYTLSGMAEVPLMAVVITIILSLLGNFLTLVGISFIYAWVYNNTKSVFIAIILHALSNFIPAILLGEGNQALNILLALMPWVVVFVLEKMYGKESFPGE